MPHSLLWVLTIMTGLMRIEFAAHRLLEQQLVDCIRQMIWRQVDIDQRCLNCRSYLLAGSVLFAAFCHRYHPLWERDLDTFGPKAIKNLHA